MAEHANHTIPGAEFLIQRYEAAKAVPDGQRTHDVAAFVRSYELVGEMTQALPWVEATPPAPPPLPSDVLCAGLLKYFQAQRIRVHDLAYPFVWAPHLLGQLYPLWGFRLPGKESSGSTSKVPSFPGPAYKSACNPTVPLADAGTPLLPGLLRMLWLGELLASQPRSRQQAQIILGKVAAALRDPAQGAQLRQELAALGQGPPVPGSTGSTSRESGSPGGDVRGSSSSGTGSGGGQGLIMRLEELECYTLAQLANVEACQILELVEAKQKQELGPRTAALALLGKANAAAHRLMSLAPDDPTSHSTLVTLHNIAGRTAEGLASLERCLALSEQLGSQYNIASYATSVGFCAVQLFEERYKGGLARSPKAHAASRRLLAQRLAGLASKAKAASKAVQGLLPEPALGCLRNNRRQLKALVQRFAASEQGVAGIITPEVQKLARVPSVAEAEAAYEMHCSNCRKLAVSAKACGRCRRVYYCSKECQREHWKRGHREECRG